MKNSTVITKKELTNLVHTSIDAFGRMFEIDNTDNCNAKFTLIATREAMRNEVKINFNGKKFTGYVNTAAKKDFIDCVYDKIANA